MRVGAVQCAGNATAVAAAAEKWRQESCRSGAPAETESETLSSKDSEENSLLELYAPSLAEYVRSLFGVG